MGRPRDFNEAAILDATAKCFWSRGYEATSIRDLIERTGLTGASLYNAFGDKRSLYLKSLDRYVADSVADRIARCEKLPPLEALRAFFAEILKRSLTDREHKGCMLVNAALEVTPHDAEFREAIANVLRRIEGFFLDRIEAGQADGTVTRSMPAEELAQHLLGILMGVRVLARVRPERALLESVVAPALALLNVVNDQVSPRR